MCLSLALERTYLVGGIQSNLGQELVEHQLKHKSWHLTQFTTHSSMRTPDNSHYLTDYATLAVTVDQCTPMWDEVTSSPQMVRSLCFQVKNNNIKFKIITTVLDNQIDCNGFTTTS